MKKRLLASITLAGCCVSAFGQGLVIFQNLDNSSAGITLNTPAGPNTGSGLIVNLYWYNGSSFVLEDTFTSTFTGGGQNGQYPGFFWANAGSQTVNIPATGLQTFKVTASFTTNDVTYTGDTGSFVSQVNQAHSPTPPLGIDLGPPTGRQAGGWNGNLVLTVPEPSTIALGGLGAAALLLFRRRK